MFIYSNIIFFSFFLKKFNLVDKIIEEKSNEDERKKVNNIPFAKFELTKLISLKIIG